MEDKEQMLGGGNIDTEEQEQEQDNGGKPEGGWGWVVCCGTFSVNFIVFGIHNSFGVVYEYLVDEKNMGEAETGKIKSQTTVLRLIKPNEYLSVGGKGKVCIRAKWPIRSAFIPVSVT